MPTSTPTRPAGAQRFGPQTSVQLEHEQLRLLDERAAYEKLRRSDIIRRAIDVYFGLRQPDAIPQEPPV